MGRSHPEELRVRVVAFAGQIVSEWRARRLGLLPQRAVDDSGGSRAPQAATQNEEAHAIEATRAATEQVAADAKPMLEDLIQRGRFLTQI